MHENGTLKSHQEQDTLAARATESKGRRHCLVKTRAEERKFGASAAPCKTLQNIVT